jgi:hypothetical protein
MVYGYETDVSVFSDTTSFHALIEFVLDNSHVLSQAWQDVRRPTLQSQRSDLQLLAHSRLKHLLSMSVLG